MMNKEKYEKELIRMWDSVRDDKYKGRNNCEGVICSECQFCDINDNDNDCYEPINAVEMVEVVEKWSKEHPPKKFKVSKLEFDILEIYYVRDREWHIYEILEDEFLSALFEEGYFKGATRNMTIEKYLRNCEVVDDTDKR